MTYESFSPIYVMEGKALLYRMKQLLKVVYRLSGLSALILLVKKAAANPAGYSLCNGCPAS